MNAFEFFNENFLGSDHVQVNWKLSHKSIALETIRGLRLVFN